MVDLPQKKVGIVACSGEELPEGTVTRLAALKVLDTLRPAETVTICLPLFLAGGEGDRHFARFYPTITLDGCEMRCAAKATEMYSAKPAASLVVSELLAKHSRSRPLGRRRLDQAGREAVDLTAAAAAEQVDAILAKKWDRRSGGFLGAGSVLELPLVQPGAVEAPCACGSGIPLRTVLVQGQPVTFMALPLIFEQFRQAGRPSLAETASELLGAVGIYNPIPTGAEGDFAEALLRDYAAYCAEKEPSR